MNWYNMIKKAISFKQPGKRDDALQRAEEMSDSGDIPDDMINNLLDDIGYPQPEQEEWSEEKDRPWDWQPEESAKPSQVDPDEPAINALLRSMSDTITANEPVIIRKAKAKYKGMPTFDHINEIITDIADELIQTTSVPNDPIAQSFIINQLYEFIPQLFGTTSDELYEQSEQSTLDEGRYFDKQDQDYGDDFGVGV